MGNFLDGLISGITRIASGAVVLPKQGTLNFQSGASVTNDGTTGQTLIDVLGGQAAPGVTTVPSLTALGPTIRENLQIRAVNSLQRSFQFLGTVGAGKAGDGITYARPDDVSSGSAGRWVAIGVPVIPTIAALRLADGGFHSTVHLQYYATIGDGGGGIFDWNASSTAVDDGGTIIAPTGLSTGRWIRRFSGDFKIEWFGPATVGNSTAFNNCLGSSNFPTRGGVIDATFLTGSQAFSTAINSSKPAVILFGSVLATFAAKITFTAANLVIRGAAKEVTTLRVANNVTLLSARGDFSGTAGGIVQWEFENLTFDGGDGTLGHVGTGNKIIDLTADQAVDLVGFTEGLQLFRNCTIQYFGALAYKGGQSAQHAKFENVYFYCNYQCVYTGLDAETTFSACWNTSPATYAAQFTITGPKVWLEDMVLLRGNRGAAISSAPDILIKPVRDGSTAYVWMKNVVCGPEGEDLWDVRSRVLVEDTDNPDFVAPYIKIDQCYFGGSAPYFIGVTASANNSGVVTVDFGSQLHGIPVGQSSKIYVSTAGNVDFCGTFIATATTIHQVTYSQSTLAGLGTVTTTGLAVWNAGAHPIKATNPLNRPSITRNEFGYYCFGAKVDGILFSGEPFGEFGEGVWEGNKTSPPNGMGFLDFDGAPLGFGTVKPSTNSGTYPFSQSKRRVTESFGATNIIQASELLSDASWIKVTGISVAGSQTDPLGGSTAWKVTAANNRTVAVHYQCLNPTIDFTPPYAPVNFVEFWAKAGTFPATPVIGVSVFENGTTNLIEQVTFQLTSTWQRFSVPVVFQDVTKQHTLMFSIGPVTQPIPTELYLWHPRMGNAQGDLYISTGTSAGATVRTASHAFEGLILTRGTMTQGNAPTVAASPTGLGASGTAVIEAGSTDEAGTILLRPAGAGPAASGALYLTFAAALADTASPVPAWSLADGAAASPTAGAWDNACTIRGGAAFLDTSPWTRLQIVWANNGVALTAGSEYRINYQIKRRR